MQIIIEYRIKADGKEDVQIRLPTAIPRFEQYRLNRAIRKKLRLPMPPFYKKIIEADGSVIIKCGDKFPHGFYGCLLPKYTYNLHENILTVSPEDKELIKIDNIQFKSLDSSPPVDFKKLAKQFSARIVTVIESEVVIIKVTFAKEMPIKKILSLLGEVEIAPGFGGFRVSSALNDGVNEDGLKEATIQYQLKNELSPRPSLHRKSAQKAAELDKSPRVPLTSLVLSQKTEDEASSRKSNELFRRAHNMIMRVSNALTNKKKEDLLTLKSLEDELCEFLAYKNKLYDDKNGPASIKQTPKKASWFS